MTNQSTRALILGIDGGEASISLRGGVAAGRLPNLARLLSTSAYGESATTWPVHTAPQQRIQFSRCRC